MTQITSPTTAAAPPISPTATSASQARKSLTSASSHPSASDIIPLDSPVRNTPIHHSIPAIKLPATDSTTNTHPLTLQPFSDSELKALGYEKLRAQYEDPNGGVKKAEIEKVRDEAVRMLRERLNEREAKEREIDREIDEKEKIREVERKVYRKKMADKGKEGP